MNLSELIRSVMTNQAVGYPALIDRARAAGYTLTAASLSQMVNRDLKEFPKRETIFALAEALEVSPAAVTSAAAHQFGIHVVPADSPNGIVVVSAATDEQGNPLGRLTDEQVERTRARIGKLLDELRRP